MTSRRLVCLHVFGVVFQAVDEFLGLQFANTDSVHGRKNGIPKIYEKKTLKKALKTSLS